MRVVAGEFRGRRLLSPGHGEEVRPTADRVREAVFSILGDIEGLSVLDLYCGTGALAIEALSRGAEWASLVDVDIRPARRNIEALGLYERAELTRSDSGDYLLSERRRFDLIFCDPPYKLGHTFEGQLDELIPPRLAEGGRVIAEAAAKHPLQLPSLKLRDTRKYGSTAVTIYEEAE